MQTLLFEVHENVGDNTTVSKGTVFPLFTKLAQLQHTVVEEQRMLVVKYRILEEMESWLALAEMDVPQVTI